MDRRSWVSGDLRIFASLPEPVELEGRSSNLLAAFGGVGRMGGDLLVPTINTAVGEVH